MTDPNQQLTPLGALLEQARARKNLAKREAARRAGISEGRWRQVVTGVQKAGPGKTIPVRYRANTVVAMARAVEVPVDQALHAAGFSEADIQRVLLNTPAGPDWDDKLVKVQAIADNPDRPQHMRDLARAAILQIDAVLAAEHAEHRDAI